VGDGYFCAQMRCWVVVVSEVLGARGGGVCAGGGGLVGGYGCWVLSGGGGGLGFR